MLHSRPIISIVLAMLTSTACLAFATTQSAYAEGKKLLHGGVDKEGSTLPAECPEPTGPSLSRADLGKTDAQRQGNRLLDGSVTDLESAQNRQVQSCGVQRQETYLPGESLPGIAAQSATLTAAAVTKKFIPIDEDPALDSTAPANTAVDPDSTPDMILAWDIWHHRVAQAIFEHFKTLASQSCTVDPSLVAKVAYVVTRDGRVGNFQFVEKSSNIMFNAIIIQSIKSINGDKALLEFPAGSRRLSVDKQGNFDMAGRGAFRYTTGDKERIPRR